MRERFTLDREQNILFINFAGLRIESREQVDEMAQCVRAAYEAQGRRIYAVADYEGTEIAPEIIDYYGERIKELHDRYGIATVRYSSSGLTRSVLRYLGAAKDLESNTFATREEAIRAIQEIENQLRSETVQSAWSALNPRRSLTGRLLFGWLPASAALIALTALLFNASTDAQLTRVIAVALLLVFVVNATFTALLLHVRVLRPLRRMERMTRQLVTGSHYDPVTVPGRDEISRLAVALNETAEQLRGDIERLSGLYHISLMIGTGTDVSRICELLTRKIARLLGAEMCMILFYNERERQLYAQLPGYGVSDETLGRLRTNLDEQSIVTFVLKSGEPYLTNDAAADPHISRAAAQLLGVREMLAVPLQAGERKLGALAVMNKSGGFLEKDKQLVMIFASQAAQLLANAQLFDQVIMAERLAAVGELVAGVAHEVRNPLFGITTTLSALSRRLEDRETVQPFLAVINTEVEHLNHLMEQLLEHSRPLRFEAAASDIREVIHEAMAELRPQAEAGNIALHCDCAAATKLRFDRHKMHGVFANLLENAIQHTAPNGQVKVAVAASANDPGRYLQIEVSDTGAGIAPENIGKIFEPFFTTRPKGTGLGLAITRKTIHDHGGTITVRSDLGSGTTFSISLPLSPEPH
ncbi:MAG TPA: ATP-binding protein [Blastocatellia bacterium]|nr:ATP-binding protein [Blastocatellia bacterium]